MSLAEFIYGWNRLQFYYSVVTQGHILTVCLIFFPLFSPYFSRCISCVLTTFLLLNEGDNDDENSFRLIEIKHFSGVLRQERQLKSC